MNMSTNEEKSNIPKKLTPADVLLWRSFWGKRASFFRKGTLGGDGSFYYDDKRLALEHHLSERTVARSVRRLEAMGKIRCQRGKNRGRATKYWVLEKPDFLSPFPPSLKADNLSGKADNLSSKARQNVPPNINNNLIKKGFSPPKDEMTNEQRKEMHEAFKPFFRK
jgi:hypothetical protein